MRPVDSDLAPFKSGIALFFPRFKSGLRPGKFPVEFGLPLPVSGFKGVEFRGGPGLEIMVQPLLARGKVLDRALERVQQREHFIDAQIPIHSRS